MRALVWWTGGVGFEWIAQGPSHPASKEERRAAARFVHQCWLLAAVQLLTTSEFV